jgi:ABC-type multidrug transport system fused ATPase/permease subunit
LEIKNISFAYPNTDDNVLENISFDIEEGQSIGLIGPSGAGKTTLVDIILSLLKPSDGEILIDGTNIEDLGGQWNSIIGYVPQSLYILDDSIRRNVAFGEPIENIDDKKVWEALRIAQLDDFVKTLPNQLETQVGEWGTRFSGGQRQRMAIARALYRNPEILVLDEATAALDNETEKDVMQAIENLQGYKTLIIVAHRLSTVQNCDTIYEVKDKGIFEKNKEEVFSE